MHFGCKNLICVQPFAFNFWNTPVYTVDNIYLWRIPSVIIFSNQRCSWWSHINHSDASTPYRHSSSIIATQLSTWQQQQTKAHKYLYHSFSMSGKWASEPHGARLHLTFWCTITLVQLHKQKGKKIILSHQLKSKASCAQFTPCSDVRMHLHLLTVWAMLPGLSVLSHVVWGATQVELL